MFKMRLICVKLIAAVVAVHEQKRAGLQLIPYTTAGFIRKGSGTDSCNQAYGNPMGLQ
jgi:hypothetical protein